MSKYKSKPKSTEQIEAEVASLKALRDKVPEHNFFGEKNRAAIDAQCLVLGSRMSLDEIDDAYGERDDCEFDRYVFDAAVAALDWMVGDLAVDEPSPSQGWSELARG